MTEQLRQAIINLCWAVTPYGEDEDGWVTRYIVASGYMHQLVGTAQGAGIPATFRAINVHHNTGSDHVFKPGTTVDNDPPSDLWCDVCGETRAKTHPKLNDGDTSMWNVPDEERRQLVAHVFRWLSNSWISDRESDIKWAADCAHEVGDQDPSSWWCCPLCQEVECDYDCPLAPIRNRAIN